MDDARDHRNHRDRCQRVQAVLPFYPRGDLPRDTFSAVTRHLADCLRCRHVLADVQATYHLLQTHLNTAPIGNLQHVKAAIMAGLGLPATGRDQPPASAPVPALVVVRRAVHQEHLPWPRRPGWPGADPPAPRSRR
jgi:anti-sigma factor RsiW